MFDREIERLTASDTSGTRNLLRADCFSVEVRAAGEKRDTRPCPGASWMMAAGEPRARRWYS